MQDGAWERLGRRVVHDGRVRLVEHDVRLPDGASSTYLVDESLPCAVACLLRAGDRFVLTSQYRFPLDRWVLDLPGGGCRQGEPPVAAAARECEEELGLVPQDLTPLVSYSADPGRAAWSVHVFSGTAGTERRRPVVDAAEVVHERLLHRQEIDRLVLDGAIEDPTLLIAWQAATLRGLV